MFSVTLINLTPDAQTAVEGQRPIELGMINARSLSALLDTFAALDAIQNLKLDPEIRVQTKRDRYIIRTGQGKLFLYDARRLSEPAYVDSSAGIIAEIDGSAAALRSAAPFSMAPETEGYDAPAASGTSDTASPLIVPQTGSQTLVLAGLAILLSGYIAYTEFSARNASALPALASLTPNERAKEDAGLIGVYMTGSQPGSCGLVVLGDGNLKIFRVNHQAAPSTVYGTYRLGRIGSLLYLATDQPGGLIKVTENRTLEYAGEKFERIQ
ncbi:MAG: hypothetical protein EXS37_18220 [Opitutus sp.]|nr:hypothetical protein [Opitutus sp.]